MQNQKLGKSGPKQLALLAVSIFWMLLLVGCQAAPKITATPFVVITAKAVVSPTAQVTMTPQPATAVPTPTPVSTVVPPVVERIAGDRSMGDAYIPELGNTGYDVQQYTLRLALDPAHMYVDGHVTMEAVTTIQNIAQISLDFIGFEIEELTLDGSPVDYVREGRKLVVDFPEPLPVGEAFALDVIYRGMPVFEQSAYVPFISHLGLQFPENGQNGSLFAISEPDGAATGTHATITRAIRLYSGLNWGCRKVCLAQRMACWWIVERVCLLSSRTEPTGCFCLGAQPSDGYLSCNGCCGRIRTSKKHDA
jgi:hypothetical protein